MSSNTTQNPTVACVIVAGGSGTRLGGEQPKQFQPLAGKPLVAWSAEYFGNHPAINKIVLVVPQGWEDRGREILGSASMVAPWTVVTGGSRRQDSVLAGAAACRDFDLVAIHDGARPFPPENLEEILLSAQQNQGAIFAMPATDSIKNVAEDKILNTVPRAGLWAAQTPQVFTTARLIEALTSCNDRGIELTDDASAFEQMGWPVTVVLGTRLNVKITYREDFLVAEHILKGRT